MTSFHKFLLKFCRTLKPKNLTLSSHLAHSLSTIPQFKSTHQDPSKIIATQISNCTNLSVLNQIHAHIIRTHVPESFHWNNVIRCYSRLHDLKKKALYVFAVMLRVGVLPDCYTIPIVMNCVCRGFDVVLGLQVHAMAIRIGLDCNEFCETGFINLYTKTGDFGSAYKVFDGNCERKLGSWNAIIGGLAQGGHATESINMFLEMRKCGFLPDDVTMVSVTSACGSLGDLGLGVQLHKCVFQARNLEKPDILMMNSLIDMYGKCGRMDLAHTVFSKMVQRNVSSWTSMIVGHAMHGHITEALECFRCMRDAQVKPNHVTFVGVLSACVHGGMVREGKHYFEMMKKEYGIMPMMQHYGCMADLLGRAGLFDEVREMVEGMPMRASSVIWGCLMGACEKHENVEMGEYVAKHLKELEPWNDGVYVVLSNIYASLGLWKEAERVRGFMKEIRLSKVPAYSLTTTSN